MTRHRNILLLVFCVGLLAGAAEERYHLVLPNAIPVGESRHSLELDLVIRDGAPDPLAWGWTAFMPGVEMPGDCVAIPSSGGAATFEIRLPILHHRHRPMFMGGDAKIALSFRRTDNALSGQWHAEFTPLTDDDRIQAVLREWRLRYIVAPGERLQLKDFQHVRLTSAKTEGALTGSVSPVEPMRAKSLPAPGKHPRLLFTKAQLPALRAHAETDEGKAKVARLRDLLANPPDRRPMLRNGGMRAAGFGFLYQLTGDVAFARKAAAACKGPMTVAYAYGQWHQAPYTVMGMALAYDMCYDAWSETELTVQYSYLEQQLRQIAQRADQPDLLATGTRFDFRNQKGDFVWPTAHEPNQGRLQDRCSAMIAALALMNDPPMVYRPASAEDAALLPPAADYEPWFGVPVVDFIDSRMPDRWLINGPFLRADLGKMIAQTGDLATLRPRPGQTVNVEGIDVDWRMYLPAWRSSGAPRVYVRECGRYFGSATGGGYLPGIELRNRWRERFQTKYVPINVWLYTVIRNDRERIAQATPNWGSASWGTRMWLNGREVRDGDLVRLQPGLYPLMVDLPIMGGYSNQQPKLREFGPDEYARAREDMQRAESAFSGDDPRDNRVVQNLEGLVRSFRRFVDQHVSSAGHGVETSQVMLLCMLEMYRRVMGVDLGEGNGLSQLVPLAMRHHHHSIMTEDTLIYGYPLASESVRPLARWFLDTRKIEPDIPLESVFDLCYRRGSDPSESPVGRIPLAVRDDLRETFRFVGGLVNRLHPMLTVQGANGVYTPHRVQDATLHLRANGHNWIAPLRPTEPNELRNGVTVSGCCPNRPARTVHHELLADGSGSVTFDLGPLFDYRNTAEEGDRPHWVYAKEPVPHSNWTRKIAIDYSGACGAPILLVIADHVTMLEHREKTMRLDLGRLASPTRDAKKPEGLELDTHGFVLLQPRGRVERKVYASMKATYIGSTKPELAVRALGEDNRDTCIDAIIDRADTFQEKTYKKLVADLAAGYDTTGDAILSDFTSELDRNDKTKRGPTTSTFLTIITIQTGKPPRVVQSDGDTLSARVGNRLIRLDNKRILLTRYPLQ